MTGRKRARERERESVRAREEYTSSEKQNWRERENKNKNKNENKKRCITLHHVLLNGGETRNRHECEGEKEESDDSPLGDLNVFLLFSIFMLLFFVRGAWRREVGRQGTRVLGLTSIELFYSSFAHHERKGIALTLYTPMIFRHS